MWPFKRKAIRSSRATPTPPYVDGTTWAALGVSQSISPRAAESLAAVSAAVCCIASTVASLPCFVTQADDDRAEVPAHPLSRLIKNGCNSSETWFDICEAMLASALLRGNALIEIGTDGAGRLSSLRTVPWASTTAWVDSTGELFFDWLPTHGANAGKRTRLLREDVVHLKDRSDDGYIGRARIDRAAASLQSAIELQRQSTQFSAQSVRPSGLLTSEQKISPENAGRFKQDWQDTYASEGKGTVAVLHSGLEFKPLSLLTAEDAQLVELKNFSVADVSRVFGVPAWLLGDPSRLTFASSREAMRAFNALTLAPWAARVEQAFQASVLSPQYRLHFDLASLTKSDTEAHSAALLRGRQGGWLSPNDCRQEMGWPAAPDGDDISPPNTSAAAVAPGEPPADAPAAKLIDIRGRYDR